MSPQREIKKEVNVERQEPLYWHHPISRRKGNPWFRNFDIQSDDNGESWRARFTLGQSPKNKDEFELLGQNPLIRSHPYFVSKTNRGFDVIRKSIVLEPRFFVDKNHPDTASFASAESGTHNYVRGEIELLEGFRSSEEKTGVHRDKNWVELISKLKQILHGELAGPSARDFPGCDQDNVHTYRWWKHIEYNKPPDEDDEDESVYRIGVINHFKKNKPIHKSWGTLATPMPQIINVENDELDIPVGRIDIVCNKDTPEEILCEVKAPGVKIRGTDVYQLFLYMQERGVKWGLMIGDDLGPSAKNAISNIHKQTFLVKEKADYWKPKKKGIITFDWKNTYKIGFWDCGQNGDGIHTTTDYIIED